MNRGPSLPKAIKDGRTTQNQGFNARSHRFTVFQTARFCDVSQIREPNIGTKSAGHRGTANVDDLALALVSGPGRAASGGGARDQRLPWRDRFPYTLTGQPQGLAARYAVARTGPRDTRQSVVRGFARLLPSECIGIATGGSGHHRRCNEIKERCARLLGLLHLCALGPTNHHRMG